MFILSVCENPDILKVIYFIQIIIDIVKTIIPIALIILVSIDCVKGVASSDAKVGDILKINKNRLLAALLVFCIPTIVNIVLEIIGQTTSYEACWVNLTSEKIEYYEALAEKNKPNGDETGGNNSGDDSDDDGILENDVLSSGIDSITNDGIIVTINAEKNKGDIAGYYFSYTKNRPNKNSGGYLETDKTTFDVVRLPGTTYVWVEYESGKISNYSTITLSNDVLTKHVGKGYKILQGTKLADYLKSQGWSIEEFNKLIARSVRAAGLHTKKGAATAATAVQIVLMQKYGIKIPYWMGGKQNNYGALSSWGMYLENKTYEGYYYYGLDCDGFVNWSYSNAGFPQISSLSYYTQSQMFKDFKEEIGEPGDVIRSEGHVSIIIGKTDTGFIIAQAAGRDYGLVISINSYSNSSGQNIIKGEDIIEANVKVNSNEYPKGF